MDTIGKSKDEERKRKGPTCRLFLLTTEKKKKKPFADLAEGREGGAKEKGTKHRSRFPSTR